MSGVPAHKGRAKRKPHEKTAALYAVVAADTKAQLEAGAAALNISLAMYLDLFVTHVTTDETGLPRWVRKRLEEDQLPMKTA